MPKVVVDSALLAELRALETAVGNRSKLAAMLDVDRSTLWRFCKSGRAIKKTRKAIRNGLIRIKNETNDNYDKVKPANAFTFTGSIHEDMQTLRLLCTTILAVLDGYEKLLANKVDKS